LIVAFDTWVLQPYQRNGGIYNYAKSLLREFQSLVGARDELTVRPFFARGCSDEAVRLGTSDWIKPVNTRLLRFHRFWQLGGITAAAARIRADLIFSPTSHICPLGPIPVITTIHDATPVLSPSWGSRVTLLERIWLWNAVKFSAQCITDSECTKRDIVEIYGVPPEKITVAYLGYDRKTFNPSPVDPGKQSVLFDRYGIKGPYIFHHGAVQPRKNLERLIRACQLLWDTGRDLRFHLVLAGPLGWRYRPILEAADKVGGVGKVVFTGALSDEDLALLLKGAELCVIPSLYEGFCLPMVEAMACGVPTVVSNSSCFPEVSGGVLEYFDAHSVEEMAETIRLALEDSCVRDRLRHAGLARAAEFSWERCARETMRIFAETSARYGRKHSKLPFS
jgi:glycosyltransferase involved in cell wall biosynthesis